MSYKINNVSKNNSYYLFLSQTIQFYNNSKQKVESRNRQQIAVKTCAMMVILNELALQNCPHKLVVGVTVIKKNCSHFADDQM